jgi:hypothetical protein
MVGESPPLAKGDPVLGISGLDPHILEFSTPDIITPPLVSPWDYKTNLENKRVIKTIPKKMCGH